MYLQKVIEKNFSFAGILSPTNEKRRIWIRKSVVRIRGSGTVPKCHGSTTLVKTKGRTKMLCFQQMLLIYANLSRHCKKYETVKTLFNFSLFSRPSHWEPASFVCPKSPFLHECTRIEAKSLYFAKTSEKLFVFDALFNH